MGKESTCQEGRMMSKYCKRCGNELKEGTKFCPKCGTLVSDFENADQNEDGSKIGQYKTLPKAKKKKIILMVCVALVILLLVNSFIGGGSRKEYTVSEFLQRYNELTQTGFAEMEMNPWEEITFEDMETVGAELSQFKDVENITAYAYGYQGVYSSPGVIFVYVDESDIVVGATFVMNTEYIAGNDNFHHIVLDSLIKSFDSTLSEDEVYEIKSYFSMQDHLIGAVTRSSYGEYEYNDKIYVVSEANGLTFSMYSKDEII